MSRHLDVEVDPARCVGTRLCSALAADTFRYDTERGVSEVIATPVAADDDEVLLAAESCPVAAILVRDAATGEQMTPES